MTATTARLLSVAEWAAHPARLDPDVLVERDGVGFAGRGVAHRLEVPPLGTPGCADEARAALAALALDVPVAGARPVACCTFPFRPGPGVAIVPALVVGRDPDGTCWELRTPAATDADAVLREHGLEPDGFVLRSAIPQAEWVEIVDAAVKTIAEGELGKVVLARAIEVEADRAIVVPSVLGRLRALFPTCTTFLVDGFLGATPELLVERHGNRVSAHPLAGTAPRSGDPEADRRAGEALLASPKDRNEHAFVVAAIAEALHAVCIDLEVPETPTILGLRNVLHLATHFEGHLRADGEGTVPTALDLAALLHPTPAVAGTPTALALSTIDAVERLDRGRYAGPVGWFDAGGDGALYVGIRSADVSANRARMVSGVGVVEGSDGQAELAETQVKLQAMLAALVRP